MATIKAYTDLQQSKKLAEILYIESADMWYQHTGFSIKDGSERPLYFPMVIRDHASDEDIPCWSLAALLNILGEDYSLGNRKGKYYVCMTHVNHDISKFDNPVDACVDMIIGLKESEIL